MTSCPINSIVAALALTFSLPDRLSADEGAEGNINLPGDLVGWWSGDSNTTDGAGNHDGVASNLNYAPGKFGDAFAFAGTDSFVRVPTSEALRAFREITIAAWVRVEATGLSGRIITLTPDWVRLRLDDGLPSFVVFLGGSAILTAESSQELFPETWHHLTGAYDGVTARLFLDGTQVGEESRRRPTPLNNFGAASELYLGFLGENGFDGGIDEAMVFDTALSPSEISAYFDAGESSVCSFPQAEPAQLPPITLQIALAPFAIEIRFPTEEGARYLLQSSQGLFEWQDDGNEVLGTGSEVVVRREASEGRQFWRVVKTANTSLE